MVEVIKIPKINPKESEVERKVSVQGTHNEERRSVLVPKISPLDNKKKKTTTKPKRRRFNKFIKIAGVMGLAVLVVAIVFGVLFYRVYQKAVLVNGFVNNLLVAGEEQDIEKIKQELSNTKNAVSELSNTYKTVSWLKAVPYFGDFIEDGEHGLRAAQYGLEAGEIIVAVIEPYADIIGFTSNSDEAENPTETTQDRLDFVINTIPDVIPKADELSEKVEAMRTEVDQFKSRKR